MENLTHILIKLLHMDSSRPIVSPSVSPARPVSSPRSTRWRLLTRPFMLLIALFLTLTAGTNLRVKQLTGGSGGGAGL